MVVSVGERGADGHNDDEEEEDTEAHSWLGLVQLLGGSGDAGAEQ